MEVTADGFGRRPDSDLTIATLRYPWVPNEEELVESFVEPDRSLEALADDPWSGRDVLFSYLHLDDAAVVARKAVEADYDGHESFWTVAADTTADAPTARLADECFPEAERRRDLEGHEALFDLSKAEALLDWRPERSWRDY
ncbi:hypothetical protein ACFQL4_20085 [Halosimplex aquaticum]